MPVSTDTLTLPCAMRRLHCDGYVRPTLPCPALSCPGSALAEHTLWRHTAQHRNVCALRLTRSDAVGLVHALLV